jgi:hypothetical protein
LEESDAIHQLLHVHIIGSDHNGADGLFLSAVLGVRSAIATPAPGLGPAPSKTKACPVSPTWIAETMSEIGFRLIWPETATAL